MSPKKTRSILLLDPATSWGNNYEALILALEEEGFDVNIFEIVPLKDQVAYGKMVKKCILMLENCDILLKPQDCIVDYWLAELASEKSVGLKKILEYAKSNNKVVVTFEADWAGFPPSMDNIYFDDSVGRIVAEIKSRIR